MSQATASPLPDQVEMVSTVEKQHFAMLDFLRGIAAIAVFIVHWNASMKLNWFRHGYLAVDFFLLMSGFVISYSYDEKLRSGYSLRQFFIARFIRLYPMIALGAFIGFLIELKYNNPITQSWPVLSQAIIAHLFLLPFNFMPATGVEVYFPLNSAHWSLFFEVVAYVLYVTILRQIGSLALIGLIFVCTLILLHIGLYANFADETIFWTSFACLARVLLSFCLGMGIKRLWQSGRLPKINLHPVLLGLALYLPMLPSEDSLSNLAEVGVILLVFPVILSAAITSSMPRKLARIALFLGAFSYPFYAVHKPMMALFLGLAKDLFGASHTLLGQGLIDFALCAMVAMTCLIWIDVPIRQVLKRCLLKSEMVEAASI